MFLEELRDGGCISYLIGCEKTCCAIAVDPSQAQTERYLALAQSKGLRLQYVLDTHTHADHFSAARELARRLGIPCAMHRRAPAPFVDLPVEDGETLRLGDLRLEILHTPGHTADSICVVVEGHVLTGDTLLLGGTGRTDLPTGDPEALWDSLFGHLLRQDGSLRVLPAHNYKGTPTRTLAEEIATNPRLQKRERDAFVAQMRALDLAAPDHLTEALRTNITGGSTVQQVIDQASRAISFMSLEELRRRIEAPEPDFVVVDVREEHAYTAGHIPGAVNLPRGQLELFVDRRFPDPRVRILTYCEFGKISTLAAATLRSLGFRGAIALDGGIQEWKARGYPLESDGSL